MKPEKGIYALILFLQKERTLRIGRLGVFDFPVGWYVYVGSAHGPGGVRKRTDRHRKNNISKKKKWNIDYFRSEARLCEIWFSHVAQKYEHAWARAFCKMEGAMMHAEEFGARDCYPWCPTHFLQYETRPRIAVLRHRLADRPEHPPVYSQFEGAFSTDPTTRTLSEGSLAASYHRGQRVVETWNRAAYDGVIEFEPTSISIEEILKRPEYKQLECKLAARLKVDSAALRNDLRVTFAIDQIIGNCGGDAERKIFSPKSKLTRRAILELGKQSSSLQQEKIAELV